LCILSRHLCYAQTVGKHFGPRKFEISQKFVTIKKKKFSELKPESKYFCWSFSSVKNY